MRSLSLKTNCGIPCSFTMPSTNFSTTTFVVNGWDKGKKCVYLLRRSTITIMVFRPWKDGNPSMKSVVISSHTWQGIGSGWRSPAKERLLVLFIWQTSQDWTYSLIVRCMEGQYNCCASLLNVHKTPEWPPILVSWNSLNNWWINGVLGGTTIRVL